MKILLLCNKFPFPAKDGGAIATFNLIKAFSKSGNDVTVLAMNTSKHYFNVEQLPDDIKKLAHFISVDVNNKINAVDAFINFIQNKSYNISRFISVKFNDRLIELLHEKEFDVVQLEGLYLSPYVETIRAFSEAKIAMRAHNIEHLIWERNAVNEKNILKKKYLKTLAKQLKKYELSRLSKYDYLIPISDVDAEYFKKLDDEIPVHVCPASFDEELLKPDNSKTQVPSLFFLASLDWIPNVEGLKWFLDNVWGKVSAEFPELKFYIAGRNMTDAVKKLFKKNAIMLGEIDDAYSFMNSKQIMIVPLFSGSGMRVKIIEGMAMGKVIISTAIGAEGIEAENNKNILLANNKEEFISQIRKCITDKQICETLGENAKKFVQDIFSARSTAKNLIDFYKKQIGK